MVVPTNDPCNDQPYKDKQNCLQDDRNTLAIDLWLQDLQSRRGMTKIHIRSLDFACRGVIGATP